MRWLGPRVNTWAWGERDTIDLLSMPPQALCVILLSEKTAAEERVLSQAPAGKGLIYRHTNNWRKMVKWNRQVRIKGQRIFSVKSLTSACV